MKAAPADDSLLPLNPAVFAERTNLLTSESAITYDSYANHDGFRSSFPSTRITPLQFHSYNQYVAYTKQRTAAGTQVAITLYTIPASRNAEAVIGGERRKKWDLL